MLVLPIGAAAVVLGIGGYEYFTRPSYVSIKVQYVGMSSIIQPSSETLNLQSPAKLSDLEDVAWKLHAALQTMYAMQVLVNGTAADGNPTLKSGDEVEFLALMAGG